MRIAALDIFPLSIPFRAAFRISRGAISPQGRTVVLVRLTTDTGVFGWGEGSPSVIWSSETHESVVSALRRYLAPAVIGLPLADMDGLHRAMNQAIAPAFGTGMPIAKAAIDIAAHDALGKALGIPLWQMLGYRRSERVSLSWTVSTTDPDGARKVIAEGLERGYRHFNIKLGNPPEVDLALCRLVREMAPGSFVLGDANGGIPAHSVVARAKALQAAGLDLMEQPLPPNALTAWRELRAKVDLPIAVDETICSPVELMELIRLDAVSAFTTKVTRNAGLFPSRQCVEIARSAGLLVASSGLTDTGVGLAANIQLVAAMGVTVPAALNGPQFLEGDILALPLPHDGADYAISDAPGLGIEVDEEKVAHYSVPL